MGSISPTHVIFAPIRRNPVQSLRIRTRRIPCKTGRFRFGVVIQSQKSDFEDFQSYVKPLRLLPAAEVKLCTRKSRDVFSSIISVDELRSFYKITLQTSNLYGSNLSNLNAGVLLCLIDEIGDSILQRIPASSTTLDSNKVEGMVGPDRLGFQRGSVDEFTFEGPKLGKVEAIWVGLESGQWRIGGVSLTVINARKPSREQSDGEKLEYVGSRYDFEADDILLGEGSNLSMVELRPCTITKASELDSIYLLSEIHSPSTSELSNEESMQEYADLKFSLLLYDAFLIFLGTSIASFVVGESSGIAFLLGGTSGFMYLLLLQKSVDGLQVPGSAPTNSGPNFNQLLEELKSVVATLGLAVGFSYVVLQYKAGDDASVLLTPKELLVGMIGFLSCKVAVVLAAFKPMRPSPKTKK